MLEFSYQLQVFYAFYRGLRRSEETLPEWERDGDVFVVISSLLILVERSVVKLQILQPAI